MSENHQTLPAGVKETKPAERRFKDDGTFPNSKLPLLFYKGAFELPQDLPMLLIEEIFRSNHWSGLWRNGIYTFHHFHSVSHEVLGCYEGSARVQLGGP